MVLERKVVAWQVLWLHCNTNENATESLLKEADRLTVCYWVCSSFQMAVQWQNARHNQTYCNWFLTLRYVCSLNERSQEPPLFIRRKKLSMQYCLKLSSTAQNPAFSAVFGCKFKSAFDRKPNQIPPLGIRVQPDLHAIGFKQKDILQSTTSATPPWLLDHLRVNFDLHCFYKEDTPPDIFRNRFYELCSNTMVTIESTLTVRRAVIE